MKISVRKFNNIMSIMDYTYMYVRIVYNNTSLLIREYVNYSERVGCVLDIEHPLQPTIEELEYYRVIYGDEVIDDYLACVNYYWEKVDGKPKYSV